MAEIRTLPQRRPEHDKNNYLRRSAKNYHSQMGEDGIIEAIFGRIGTDTKWAVEFGAWDGVWLSNACRLIREFGWRAVMIEGNEERAAKIAPNYAGYPDVHGIHAYVGLRPGENTIDEILARTPIPRQFDLISIDVDGNDYHIWKSITEHRPRIVACEFNPMIPNDVIFIQEPIATVNEGNSLAALVELGREKGYELICVSHSDAFFIVKEEYSKLGITDNSINAMWPSPPHFVWSCYNGKIYHSMPTMKWGGKPAEGFGYESLQYLTRFGFHGQHQGVFQGRDSQLAQLRDALVATVDTLERVASANGGAVPADVKSVIAAAREIV